MFGFWRRVDMLVDADVSEKHAVSIFSPRTRSQNPKIKKNTICYLFSYSASLNILRRVNFMGSEFCYVFIQLFVDYLTTISQ
jgi:hypothetical protein